MSTTREPEPPDTIDHRNTVNHLLTPRLLIRPLSEDDQCQVMSLFQSLDVMRFSGTGPLSLSQSAQAFAQLRELNQRDPLSPRSVLRRGTVQSPSTAPYQDQWIGLCGLQPAPGGQSDARELAYRFLPVAWGQGFATEAARACCAHAFATTPSLQMLTVWIEPPHRQSLRVAEKLGFSGPEERVRNGMTFRVLTLERSALILEDSTLN